MYVLQTIQKIRGQNMRFEIFTAVSIKFRDLVDVTSCTRVAPKVMSPILLCWPTTSGSDVGDNGSRG
jgi:hypothetical protein